MKAIYFGDLMGNLEEERDHILSVLKQNEINIEIKITDIPPWDEVFNILFFDWGGMSMGNSMLEHFCGNILDDAEYYPQRIYVMTSSFTEAAMKDALEGRSEIPPNVFLSLKDSKTIEALKALINS